jgi:cold shock CspA family protein
MGRSQETNKKKEVRNNKQKKKKEKEKRRQARKENKNSGNMDDMIAYVNEDGSLSSTPPDESSKEETKAEDIQVSVPKEEPGEEPDPIRQGTVAFFNDNKGYGFIKDGETGENIFVHATGLQEDIQEGNRVQFEVIQGDRGLNATEVKVIR